MIGLMKFEFLLPPSNSIDFDVNAYVDKLLFIEKLCEEEIPLNIRLEEDMLSHMIAEDLFPSDNVIRTMLNQLNCKVFNANSISRILNNIIDKLFSKQIELDYYFVELENFLFYSLI